MVKKKIVIASKQMIMGGIEKALIDMLKIMSPEVFEVTLILMYKGGELVEDIPSYIKVKYIEELNYSFATWFGNNFKKGDLNKCKSLFRYRSKLKKEACFLTQCELICDELPSEENQYDIAIAYGTPVSLPLVYIANNISAYSKIAWIHNEVDYITEKIEDAKKYYFQVDNICCVSSNAQKQFLKKFPELKEKTKVIFNIVNREEIYKKANSIGFTDIFDGIRILTVGRISYEKGQDIIPDIVKILKEEGMNIRWYCVGGGDMEKELTDKIKEKKLEREIILLGTCKNPYPYYRECDLYVQPSRQEGYGISISEAKCFNKVIIAADFAGAYDQIYNNQTGYIVEFGVENIAKKIKEVLLDKEKRNTVVDNLLLETCDNNKEKLMDLLR